jgi:outer membrane protein assembly factor BamA
VVGGTWGRSPFRDQLDSTLIRLGVSERDNHNSIFPTAGSRFQLWANHNDTGLGSDFTFTKSWLIYTKYIQLSEPLVLAVEGAGCYATEGGPFYSLCMFGSKNLLRGYTVGQFLDRWTLATQAEAAGGSRNGGSALHLWELGR